MPILSKAVTLQILPPTATPIAPGLPGSTTVPVLDIGQIAQGVLAAIAIVIFGYIAVALVVRAVRLGAKEARIKPTLIDLAVAGVRGIGLLVILSGALQELGLSQVALAIGGSISLIALGITTAASGALGDIIAGVFLASDPDFGIGFTITTAEIVGTIEHVDLRKTRVRTPDGKLHIIPNKQIENNPWVVEAHPGQQAFGVPNFRLPNLPNLPGIPNIVHRPGTATAPHPAQSSANAAASQPPPMIVPITPSAQPPPQPLVQPPTPPFPDIRG